MQRRALIKVKLIDHGIITEHFGRTGATMFERWRRTRHGRELSMQEAVCFVSRTGNQVLFMFNPVSLSYEDGHGTDRNTVGYLELRVRLESKAPFDAMMLQVYANMAGIELIGIRRFETFVKNR